MHVVIVQALIPCLAAYMYMCIYSGFLLGGGGGHSPPLKSKRLSSYAARRVFM